MVLPVALRYRALQGPLIYRFSRRMSRSQHAARRRGAARITASRSTAGRPLMESARLKNRLVVGLDATWCGAWALRRPHRSLGLPVIFLYSRPRPANRRRAAPPVSPSGTVAPRGRRNGKRHDAQTDQQHLIDRPAKPLVQLATGELGDFDFGFLPRGDLRSARRSTPGSFFPPDRRWHLMIASIVLPSIDNSGWNSSEKPSSIWRRLRLRSPARPLGARPRRGCNFSFAWLPRRSTGRC